jgi:ligand-binding SRPBCC domain-containing protein
MVVVSHSIHVNAPVERVFALMSDPAARSALSPSTRPIRVEIEGGAPLKLGSVCHFRLQAANRILDYHTRVVEFEALRRIVSVSDSAVPFTVRIEMEPEAGGTRLTQTERFEPTDAHLDEALAKTATNLVLRLAYRMLVFMDFDSARRLREQQEETLARQLEPSMERWLAAIKARLEAG